MRFSIFFLLFLTIVFAHQEHQYKSSDNNKLMDVEVGLETTYTINDDLQNYKIQSILLDRESEIPKEDFELGHLTLALYKEFSKNLKSKFAISSHQINSTYIEEAFIDYSKNINEFLLNVKVGKFYSNFAFLNRHLHESFVDKPLIYKFFSDDLNDEGISLGINYKNLYFTLENLSGDEFPAKDSNEYLLGAILATISYKKSIQHHNFDFRVFGFSSEANGRIHTQKLSHTHSNTKVSCSDIDSFCFSGDVDFYGVGLKYQFDRVKILSEYIHKKEDGYLRDRLQQNKYISKENGFYIEANIDILKNLIFGLRYNRIWSDNTLIGNNVENLAQKANLLNKFTPESFNILLNYRVNRFNSIKVQYDINDLYENDNNQLSFAYVLNFDF